MGSTVSKTPEDRARDILRKANAVNMIDNRIIKPAPYKADESRPVLKEIMVHRHTPSPEEDIYAIPVAPVLDETCCMCKIVTKRLINAYMCRVCGKFYHKSCLERHSKYSKSQINLFDRAVTDIGWTCNECDDNSRLLTSSELDLLDRLFEEIDADKDLKVSEEEFVSFYKNLLSETEGREMSEDDETFERCRFRLLDFDNNGSIDYVEFMKHQTSNVLLKRDKDALVKLLTPREKFAAWTLFQYYDVNRDGMIDKFELTKSYQQWYVLYNDIMSDKSRGPGQVSSHVITAKANLSEDVDEDNDNLISWREFLRNQAIYIISSRPNNGMLNESLIEAQIRSKTYHSACI